MLEDMRRFTRTLLLLAFDSFLSSDTSFAIFHLNVCVGSPHGLRRVTRVPTVPETNPGLVAKDPLFVDETIGPYFGLVRLPIAVRIFPAKV